jgi:hypothetical protein
MPATPEQLRERWQTDDGKKRLGAMAEGKARLGQAWDKLLEQHPAAANKEPTK